VRVFLSYRRDDTGGYTGRLSDTLAERLGAPNVFHDVDAVSAGADFMASIGSALDRCDAVLAVIGPTWLTVADADGQRRLDDADDYVRRELVIAMRRAIPVVPVLVGGATLPAVGSLPEDLQPLVRHQAVAVHDASWRRDVDDLIRSLRGELPSPAPRSRSRRRLVIGAAAAAAVIAVVAVVALLAGWWDQGGSNSSQSADPPLCSNADLQAATARDVLANASGTVAEPKGVLEFTVLEAAVRSKPTGWQVLVKTRMTNETTDDIYHSYWRYKNLAVDGTPFALSCYGITAGAEVVGPQLNSEAVVGFDVTKDPAAALTLVMDSSLQIPFASAT
jgi:hypothetical protein